MFTLPHVKDGCVARLVTVFGSLGPGRERRVHYVFDVGTHDYKQMMLPVEGAVRSIALQVPAASWYERELHDQYGVEVSGHPDLRPLVFHENWPDGVHPMVDPVDRVPWASREYRFLTVQGNGIAEVAVAPCMQGY